MTRNNRHKLNLRLGTTDYQKLGKLAEELFTSKHISLNSMNQAVLYLIRKSAPTSCDQRNMGPTS